MVVSSGLRSFEKRAARSRRTGREICAASSSPGLLSDGRSSAVITLPKKDAPHLCQLLVKRTLTFSIPDISRRSSPRDPSLSVYLSTLKHPGRHRHSFQEACARYSGKIPARSPTG
ncbi:Uncharacterized protein DBV15_07581 [Temnothorax longispinosus]|uniref:Uncharacterized protein n=1 Tax=Temnothorax longispinosus TaxID=300112 RepID=A0A4S2LBK0_9HYME|nr:Uncharacterized protein DBV15_07581 [Temnothorax longispinosus]